METFAVDLLTLLRVVSNHRGAADYELKVGIEWTGEPLVLVEPPDRFGLPRPNGLVSRDAGLGRFTPVTVSVQADAAEPEFLAQIRDLATDLITQGPRQIRTTRLWERT